jgi:hypothetical protein
MNFLSFDSSRNSRKLEVLNDETLIFNMKTPSLQKPLLVTAVVLLAIFAGNAVAQNSPTSSVTQPAVASQSAPPRLSYGVPQVLQLVQAKVGDDTIVAFIQNSGTIYTLDASQIIYLRQQGVSDSVVTAMLNQRKNVTASAAQTAPPQNYSSDANATQTSTAVAQPTVTYVQTVPQSSVYVIPDTQTYNYDAYYAYYHQPYYYPYYTYPYPVSLSFGFGGGWDGDDFRGGGWHSGGGFHGGDHDGGWHSGGGGSWHGGGGGGSWHGGGGGSMHGGGSGGGMHH